MLTDGQMDDGQKVTTIAHLEHIIKCQAKNLFPRDVESTES